MRSVLLTGLLIMSTAFCVFAQADDQKNTDPATPAALPQTRDYVRPSGKTRFNWYVGSIFGPVAIAKDVAVAGIDTWKDSPEEWGPHWEGFGRRFASGLGKSIIKNSVQFGLDEAFTLDSHYYRSKDKSVGARVGNALISPVTARDRNGRRTLGFPRILGTYTASIVAAETWYPSRFTWKNGVKSGTMSLGFTAAFNLVKEFIWKK